MRAIGGHVLIQVSEPIGGGGGMRQAAKKKEKDEQETAPVAPLPGPRSTEKASTGVGGLDHL